MKKIFLSMPILMMSILLASCGLSNDIQGIDSIPKTVESDYLSSVTPETNSSGENISSKSEDDLLALKEASGESWEEEDVFLSSQILKKGETMQVLSPTNEDPENHGVDITLNEAKVFDSPEDAGLDRSQILENAENYDTSGNLEWCDVNEGKILVCDITVDNINDDEDLHMGTFMIAYADPDTNKVTMVSCAPVYLSASISNVTSSDYHHFQLPKGESKDMKVAWMIQEVYEPENLYLCVTYDIRDPDERQYFRLIEQS